MNNAHPHYAGIKHLQKNDQGLGSIIAAMPPLLVRSRGNNYFKALIESIISQQLSVKASDTIFLRFKKLFPGKHFPKPAEVLRAPEQQMRAAGLSGSKVLYIRELAMAIETKQLKLRRLSILDNEDVISELTKIKGIGRWTAEMFLMFTLGRPDVFSHGDLGLRNAVKQLYKFKQPPTQQQIEKIVAKWSPHKTLASRYLWKSLEKI